MIEQAIDAAKLQQFCDVPNEYRPYLAAPFRVDGVGIVRTNGHILIALPDDGGEFANVHSDGLAKVVRGYTGKKDQPGRVSVPLNSIVLPKTMPCSVCNGAGQVIKCIACDGEGEFDHFGYDYHCQSCDGDGFLKAATSTGQKQPCHRCDGRGDSVQEVNISGETHIQLRYLKLLAALPGQCTLSIDLAEAMSTVFYTFDGGWGAVMPIRPQREVAR